MVQVSASRRAFLKKMGVAASVAAFLPLLNASGQEPLAPRRLLLFFTPHGAGLWNKWIPTTPSNLATSPILAPLARHQSKVNVIYGLRGYPVNTNLNHAEGHSWRLPMLWSGSENNISGSFTGGGITIDQAIAKQIGSRTSYASLEFGAGCNPQLANGSTRMIWNGPDQPRSPQQDPSAALRMLFSTTAPSTAQLNSTMSSLDVVQGDIARLRPRLALADRPKLDAQLSAIFDFEKRITNQQALQAPPKLLTSNPYPLIGEPVPELDLINHMDLIASAFTSDLTRVASLQYCIGDNDGQNYTQLVGPGLDSHHATTHDDLSVQANIQMLTKVHNLFAEHFARILDRLDAIPESNGTLLDNTMVVWGSEYGEGHNVDPLPFVIGGGGGGAYKTGRYINLAAPFIESNRLMVSMANIMGVSMRTFGNLDQGSGPLTQL